MRRNVQLKGEFFLADAVNIMLERGLKMRVERVENWLDAGTPEAMLDTNRFLLDHGHASAPAAGADVTIIPPVYIHPTARISRAIIGPYASIGAGCEISNSLVEDSILEPGARIESTILTQSLLGHKTSVHGQARRLNLGDHSQVEG